MRQIKRHEAVHQLALAEYDCNWTDKEMLLDYIRDGFVGFNKYSDPELEDYWEQVFDGKIQVIP